MEATGRVGTSGMEGYVNDLRRFFQVGGGEDGVDGVEQKDMH